MAVTAPQKVLLSDALPITVKWLGIADSNYPEGTVVAAGSPYTEKQIKTLLFQNDYEIANLIVNNLEHPYRTHFVTEATDFLADGALIPAHLNHHSQVTVKIGGNDKLGRQRTFERLKQLKAAPLIYGDIKDCYAIHGGRIHFGDPNTTGKLDIPKVTKDLTLTTLLSPLPYFWAVVGGAIAHSGMVGMPESHRRYWLNQYLLYVREITGGALSIPEPEQLERLGA